MLRNYFLLKNKAVNNSLLTVLFVAFPLISIVKAEEESSTINQYFDKISEIEMTDGPHDAAIEENLISLSMIYKEQGNHIKRLEVLNQALYLHRLNYGLESKEQLGIVEKLISTNVALEDWKALDQSYEYFYWVNKRIYGTDSLDLLPALNRVMEWKLDVIERGLYGHPEIIKHQATDLLRKIRRVRKINTEKS
ncbi:MAG: hypothetical protein ACI85N_002053 [Gammaproteobacteria bacterium]|jgi:hypothetical protein